VRKSRFSEDQIIAILKESDTCQQFSPPCRCLAPLLPTDPGQTAKRSDPNGIIFAVPGAQP
jgi:hypothetical protein